MTRIAPGANRLQNKQLRTHVCVLALARSSERGNEIRHARGESQQRKPQRQVVVERWVFVWSRVCGCPCWCLLSVALCVCGVLRVVYLWSVIFLFLFRSCCPMSVLVVFFVTTSLRRVPPKDTSRSFLFHSLVTYIFPRQLHSPYTTSPAGLW